MSEFNPNQAFVDAIKLDDKGALGIDPEVIEKHLESLGTSTEELKKAQKIIGSVTNEIASAMGKVAVDTLVDKKDLEHVDGEYSVGNANTTMRVYRSKEEAVSITDRSKGTHTVYGRTELSTTNAITKSSQSNVKKDIKGYATTKLGGK